MIKFDFNNKMYKRTLLIIEYILCLLVIETILILVNINSNNNKEANIITSISQINETNITNKETIGNAKILKSEKNSYYIKVNCATQVVTVYAADENGDYIIPVRKMICSTGTATPHKGVYKTSSQFEWGTLVGNVYGQYCTRITGQILFHSVPYTRKDNSALEYWEYDKLGQPASKGCVRLTVEDAKWIYDNCKSGTKVEFYESNEDEKFSGVNTPMKISEFSDELRNWDPTDPDENNPWKEYQKQNEGKNE